MKKTLFCLIALPFLICALGAAAQETSSTKVGGYSPTITEMVALDENVKAGDLGIGEPRILPDSPFYFLKDGVARGLQSLFTFNPVAKAELSLKFANEKLMEAKKLAEKKPEVLPQALENYKVETDRLKEMVEKIQTDANVPRVEEFIDKFIDNSLKQQKLLGKMEKESAPEIYQDIERVKEENIAKFSDIGLKLASPEVLGEKITGINQTQTGSDFKQFKNLEVLQAVEARVPEDAKPAIRQAIENGLNKLREDLEKMPLEDREKFKGYVENIGGNEVRHLAVMDEFEREDLSQIVREETEKAKEKILERVGTRLQEYGEKNLEVAGKEYLANLNKQGRMEDLRIIKEMENNLSPEVMEPVLLTKGEIEKKIVKNLEMAETPEQQKIFFERVENKYYDVQQLEVFKEIEQLIPPEKKELYDKLKEKAVAKMREEVERAKQTAPEQKQAILERLSGDSPEQIRIFEEFKMPREVARQTVEMIVKKVEMTEDPARLESLKNRLEGREIKTQIVNIKPEIFDNLERQLQVSINVEMLKPERTAEQISMAKEFIEKTDMLLTSLPAEFQSGIDKQSVLTLVSAARKHLEKAEKALTDNNYGEAFGQAIASVNSSSEAQQMIYKMSSRGQIYDERLEKFKKWIEEIRQKLPELGVNLASVEATPPQELLACFLPQVPSRDACKGKWEGASDRNNCPYFRCVGEAGTISCAGEREKVNRDPVMGLTNQICCAGLVEVRMSGFYSVCQRPGSEGSLECKSDFDCPQPLCPGLSSKCIDGRCVIPMCAQKAPIPSVESSISSKSGEKACVQVIAPAISPEGKCVEFSTPCHVPEGWKKVERCPLTEIPQMPKSSEMSNPMEMQRPMEAPKPVEIRYYTCPDGTKVVEGECYAGGGCAIKMRPESQCPLQAPSASGGAPTYTEIQQPIPTPFIVECKEGEVKQYRCFDGTSVTSCKCAADGKWDCLASPEKSCPAAAIAAPPTATAEKTLVVVSPNGGEKWIMGKTYDILWKSQGVERVNIEVMVHKDGASVGNLSIAGSDMITSAYTGKYSWTPNSNHLREGNQFKITIRDAGAAASNVPGIEDESDNYFSITD